MTLQFDLFYSMRSPYSYIATGRIAALVRDFDVAVAVRPVYALAVRDPDFFKSINPMWLRYLVMDTRRAAERHGMPFEWPRPDPVVQDLETRTIAKDQPYIHRLTRMAAAAAERGRGLDMIVAVSGLIFGGTVDGWDKGDHLAKAVAKAGLDLAELDAAIAADPDHFEAIIDVNQSAQQEAGHWGTPLMVFDGEPFFGQDRIDDFIWRLEQRGLERRSR
ncbi:MAG: DsbA family protein [Alphaproteobacteria bacterium]|jgi:2-hydroxychromene-2-carboxylate isomerase|nr:DsbA family protein [Alphaproteobacteria bacterium]MDP6515058.1 DsbA family protein [Alphaproteobacteria bacterium]